MKIMSSKGKATGYGDAFTSGKTLSNSASTGSDDDRVGGRFGGLNISLNFPTRSASQVFHNRRTDPDEISDAEDRKKAIKRRLKKVRKV